MSNRKIISKKRAPADNPLAGEFIEVDDQKFMLEGALDMLNLSEIAILASAGTDMRSPQGMAMVSQFLQLTLGPIEYIKFKGWVRNNEISDDTVIEVTEQITDLMGDVIEARAGRPTGTPSASSPTQPGTDELISRRIKLGAMGGEVTIIPPGQEPQAQTS